MDPISNTPALVASTGATYSCTIAESKLRERERRDAASQDGQDLAPVSSSSDDFESNYFKSAQW
jgi:telomerase Cajal body protein 1